MLSKDRCRRAGIACLAVLLSSGCGARALPASDGSVGDGQLAVDQLQPSCPPEWRCDEREGRRYCSNTVNALPKRGRSWRCHPLRVEDGLRWICDGRSPLQLIDPLPSPCSDNWDCRAAGGEGRDDAGEYRVLRCERAEGPYDRPSDHEHVACVKGSYYGGTRCEVLDHAPEPLSKYIKPGTFCIPGVAVWCHDSSYGGWGQSTCLPDGTWPTKSVNDKTILSCWGVGGGPDNRCTSYYSDFSSRCCERIDCVVPHDAPEGHYEFGGGICAPCHITSDCTLAGSVCLVVTTDPDSLEFFCSASCGPNGECPDGFRCEERKYPEIGVNGSYCIPADDSCYL